jgi:hypothetical protein
LIQAISAGLIKGDDVFYVNADDTHKGMVTKLKIAEEYGFNVLAPNYNNFKSADFVGYMSKMVETNTARGVIIILDTLKKFCEMMDKKIASGFMNKCREFGAAGGTLIMLAHCNKNRNADGKLVYGGTSDAVDDADCAYTLDTLETNQSGKRVLFENIKKRGDVALEAGYEYSIVEGLTYQQLLDSVRSLDTSEAVQVRQSKQGADKMQDEKNIIDGIKAVINKGITHKNRLIDAVHQSGGFSKRRIKFVLDDYTGQNWRLLPGEKNAKNYTLGEN